MTRHILLLLAPLALAACSAEPPAGGNATATTPAGSIGGVAASPAPVPPARAGLPETPPLHPASALQPLVADDLKDRELTGSGCAFHASAGGPTLLFVRDEGDGLVKYDKRLRRITAATPGREAVATGGILAGDGVSFTVRRTAPADGAIEGAWPATLEMRTADQGERVYRDGRWDCAG